MALFFLNRLGVLPRSWITQNAMFIGSAVEIVTLSLALPYRMRELRRERQAIVENLATMTAELINESKKREKLSYDVVELRGEVGRSRKELDTLSLELNASEDQLIQAEKMASVGQLVASVTHDIANPTTRILVSQSAMEKKLRVLIDAAESDELNPRYTNEMTGLLRYLKFIRSGALNISEIHRSFAYYSRVDLEIRTSVDIERVLKDAMMILTTRVQPHELVTHFESCPRIACRPSEVCQGVANLVSNAADALSGVGSPQVGNASGTINLRVFPVERNEIEGVMIEVHDSGPGIAADKQLSIYKPFATTKEPGKGTGLGLAITQRVVKRHHGSIEVGTSETLGGAVFKLWLPVMQEMVEPAVVL